MMKIMKAKVKRRTQQPRPGILQSFRFVPCRLPAVKARRRHVQINAREARAACCVPPINNLNAEAGGYCVMPACKEDQTTPRV